jgi:hypothetical protein
LQASGTTRVSAYLGRRGVHVLVAGIPVAISRRPAATGVLVAIGLIANHGKRAGRVAMRAAAYVPIDIERVGRNQ